MIICPECGYGNRDEAIYCQQCQKKLSRRPGDITGNYKIDNILWYILGALLVIGTIIWIIWFWTT
jgi:uncharacterized membrane protein YvbJ